MDIRKIYEYTLNCEHEGKRFFEQNAERLGHAAAVDAFKQLAVEEQEHIEFIEAQIKPPWTRVNCPTPLWASS